MLQSVVTQAENYCNLQRSLLSQSVEDLAVAAQAMNTRLSITEDSFDGIKEQAHGIVAVVIRKARLSQTSTARVDGFVSLPGSPLPSIVWFGGTLRSQMALWQI